MEQTLRSGFAHCDKHENPRKIIRHDRHRDDLDRRRFLERMAWAGAGMLGTVSGGLLGSALLPSRAGAAEVAKGSFGFVQISDSLIGFSMDGNNTGVAATLKEATARVNARAQPPEFILHTGDLTHLSEPEEFDTLAELLKSAKPQQIFFVPGEHDVTSANGKLCRERFGKTGREAAGSASITAASISLAGSTLWPSSKTASAPLVRSSWSGSKPTCRAARRQRPSSSSRIFHCGKFFRNGAGARRTAFKRFGSVTVLNGHIRQTVKKIEGRATSHTAMSTAVPQPEPGKARQPGPLKVKPGKWRKYLGVTDINHLEGKSTLAIVDSTLI